MGSGRNEKLQHRRIPTVQNVPQTPKQKLHKHHHHGGAICPSYDVVSMYTPDWTWATSSEGVR